MPTGIATAIAPLKVKPGGQHPETAVQVIVEALDQLSAPLHVPLGAILPLAPCYLLHVLIHGRLATAVQTMRTYTILARFRTGKRWIAITPALGYIF